MPRPKDPPPPPPRTGEPRKPRVLAPQHPVLRPRATTGSGLDYPASTVGSTAHCTVLLAASLVQTGAALAQEILEHCEADYLAIAGLFGGPQPSVTIVIAPLSSGSDGTGGAYHYACDDATLYVDADTTHPDGWQRTECLHLAELVEVLSAGSWDCGASSGEGLSRALAEQAYPGVLDDYETVATWLDGSRANWVDQTDPTDQSAESTGCAVLFLNWLQAERGQTWQQIAQAGAATLATTYATLGLGQTAWADFSAAVESRWPAGTPSGVTTDDPWPATGGSGGSGGSSGPSPVCAALEGWLAQLEAEAQGHPLVLLFLQYLSAQIQRICGGSPGQTMAEWCPQDLARKLHRGREK